MVEHIQEMVHTNTLGALDGTGDGSSSAAGLHDGDINPTGTVKAKY